LRDCWRSHIFISGCPDFPPVSHSERNDACQRDVGCLANLVSGRAAPGLYFLAEALEGWDPWVVKGQITGPITILLAIQDETGHCAYRDERIRDAVVKLVAQKASLQAELLRSLGLRAVIFIREHALGRIDEFLNVRISKEGELVYLLEILWAIRESGVWSGVHICSDADWGAILQSDLDVFSFDS
jgi:hypothetical protein